MSEYVGPLSTTVEQIESVIALADRVFRPGTPGGMARLYPLLYHPERLEQLRIFTTNSHPVSLAGMILNKLEAFGCQTRVACVGSVCTDKAHRGRGLAGRLIDDAVARATTAGATIMLISGHRTLYSRRGAQIVGRFHNYTVPVESLPQDDLLSVVEVGHDHWVQALRIYLAEPIHFYRTQDDYAELVDSGCVFGQLGRTYLVRRAESALAVFTIKDNCPDKTSQATRICVPELAGSRRAVLAGLQQICRNLDVQAVRIDGYSTDCDLTEACAAVGIEPELVPSSFAVKLLNTDRLWQDFTPLLVDRIGQEMFGNLQISAQDDEMQIHSVDFELATEHFTVQGTRQVLAALFGSVETEPLVKAPNQLGRILSQALPLPLPLYGLNFT